MKPFLIILIFLSFTLTVYGQDSPVIVRQPINLESKVDSSKLFIIDMSNNTLMMRFNNKTTTFTDLKLLDNFIKNNITEIIKKQCILRYSSKQSYDKVKKVIAIFNQNSIKGYELITK